MVRVGVKTISLKIFQGYTKTFTDEELDSICTLMQTDPQCINQPITITEDYYIIDGHKRVAAALKLGIQAMVAEIISLGEDESIFYNPPS